MHPRLQLKLASYEQKLQEVDAFAKRLPLFAEQIIANELSPDCYQSFAHRYKNLPLSWGVNWYVNRPTNLPDEVQDHPSTVNVYINCMSLFHDDVYHMVRTELEERMQTIACYWYDDLNSTWYFLPEQAEHGLNVLSSWYNDMKTQESKMINDLKIKALKKQLEELESQ